MGISPRTLQNWKQGQREPDQAAKMLLRVAVKHPRAVLDAAEPRIGRGALTPPVPDVGKSDVRAKLFFLLFYLKAYPTQDVMGQFFDLSQPQVCARVAQLLPRLQTLMAAELPALHGRDLAAVLRALPEVTEVLIDRTERPIARPQHRGRRDRHYSGRRKRTTVKNVVVTAGGRVVLVTPDTGSARGFSRLITNLVY